MHHKTFGSFGPRGLPTRRRKTGQVDVIYVDMSKAFDKAYGYLLQKLHEFGLGGSVLQWFSPYLMVCYQRITVLGETSDPLCCCQIILHGFCISFVDFRVSLLSISLSFCGQTNGYVCPRTSNETMLSIILSIVLCS